MAYEKKRRHKLYKDNIDIVGDIGTYSTFYHIAPAIKSGNTFIHDAYFPAHHRLSSKH